MKLSLASVAAFMLGVAAAVAACDSGDRGFTDDVLVPANDGGATEAAPTCEGRRCSRDLHAVLDGCTDAVVETCEPASGCAKGACVTACASAAEAQGSIGCSFWTTPPDTFMQDDSSCFAAFVANTWSLPVHVKASYAGKPLDVSRSMYRALPGPGGIRYERIDGALPPNEVGIVFLAQGLESLNNAASIVKCPADVEVAHVGVSVSAHQTSLYDAYHVETDVPVSMYSIYPYGGASSYTPSATLLLPVSSWSTSYVLVDGWETTVADSFLQILADEDDTEVRIRPKVDVREGLGVAPAARGTVGRWRLAKGQILEVTQTESLAGSLLEASKKVAVFGGTKCTYIPADTPACDTLHQQIPPVVQWSNRYSGVPYASRRMPLGGGPAVPEIVPYRIVGAAEGTELTWKPMRPPGAPTKLGVGEVVTFSTEQVFSVRSQDVQHPIYLATYMTGATLNATLGDPDFVNIVPDDQFLDRYVFFVDQTYADSTLTVVRRKDARGFHDVTLDCGGVVTGFRPVDDTGEVEYAWVEVTKGGKGRGACGYGRHEATSEGGFGLYVWGTDQAASYGFPAGAGSRPTSPVAIIVR